MGPFRKMGGRRGGGGGGGVGLFFSGNSERLNPDLSHTAKKSLP